LTLRIGESSSGWSVRRHSLRHDSPKGLPGPLDWERHDALSDEHMLNDEQQQ